ncbi:MAG: GPW/gp25 family protein [Candidatus Binataceae bacterium]
MTTDAATLADITSADWSLKLDSVIGVNATGDGIGSVVQGIDDVNQCIAIILSTPKGSDPLRPTFGADLWQYIDAPIDSASPAIVREIHSAISLWEPRVKLISVSAAQVRGNAAQLQVTIAYRLNLAGAAAASHTTTIQLPGNLAGCGKMIAFRSAPR